MRLAFVGFLTAAAALTADVQSGVAQHNARFCMIHGGRSGSIPDCSYRTLEQCRASTLGMAKYCTENPNYSEPPRGSTTQRPRQGSTTQSPQQRDLGINVVIDPLDY
jgi:Protein of unknown function (DUF3551)